MARTSTARHFITTVTVNGEALGKCDGSSEIRVTAESVKHSSSSFKGRRAALGSPSETEDMSVWWFFDHERDFARGQRFTPLVGLAEVTIAKQPKDRNGSPYGRPSIITGVLSGVTPVPEHDEDSNDLSKFMLTVSPDGETG